MTKNEVGSEFWNIPVSENENRVFSDSTQWFLSGRSALGAIIAENNFKTVALPSWCCGSMVKPFIDSKIEVSFYPSLKPVKEIHTDALLVMDYFGYSGYSEVHNYPGIIIRDITHSVFSSFYSDAKYYFGSLRKWAGFWTGGYAWGIESQAEEHNDNYVMLRKSAMEEKAKYIQGLSPKKEYLKVFAEAEKLLESAEIASADSHDVELAKYFDVEGIKKQRRQNALVLLDAFKDIAIFPLLDSEDCPMFVPIKVLGGKRDKLRNFLISKNIYCPIHWTISNYHKLNDETRKVYDEELSLICDQRYGLKDMERQVDMVRFFLSYGG